ncbi:MAG: dTMP kinase [Polyangia bacterium]
MRGLFLVLEGIDGAGTTTQRGRLHAWLTQLGYAAHPTAEPSSGPIGRLIRQFLGSLDEPLEPRAMALLFAADRRDHIVREITPRLEAGAIVLSDRYVLSSLAYQTTASVPREIVAQANADILKPDLTLYFDLPVAVAAERRARRAGAVEIYDADAVQARVHATYRAEAEALRARGEPVVFIRAERDPDAVEAELRAAITPLLPARSA